MSRKILPLALATATFLAGSGSGLGQKALTAKPPNKEAVAEEKAKELVLLMDANEDGKISKQEWMKFMESEFDRLDKTKKGELDPKELRQSMMSVKHVSSASLGK